MGLTGLLERSLAKQQRLEIVAVAWMSEPCPPYLLKGRLVEYVWTSHLSTKSRFPSLESGDSKHQSTVGSTTEARLGASPPCERCEEPHQHQCLPGMEMPAVTRGGLVRDAGKRSLRSRLKKKKKKEKLE